MPLDGVEFLRLDDHNGVAFSKELPEWGRTLSDFWDKAVLHVYG